MLLKVLFLGLIILSSAHAELADTLAQTTEQTEAIKRMFSNGEAWAEEKDWPRAAGIFTRIIGTAVVPDAQANITADIAWSYFHLARAETRLGHLPAALHALEQAIAFGIDDLRRLAGDGDLDGVRALPRYQELMKLARERAGERSEIGRLLRPNDRCNISLEPKDCDRLALMIPATELIRERALILTCTKTQRRQLIALMDWKDGSSPRVRITGTGGTASTDFRFKVASFAVAADGKP